MSIWDAPSDRDYYGQDDGDYIPEEQEPPVCVVCEEATSEAFFAGSYMCADCAALVSTAHCPDCFGSDLEYPHDHLYFGGK